MIYIKYFITKTSQNRIHFSYECEIAKLDPFVNLKGFVLENITSIQNVEPEFIAFFIFSALFYKVSTNMFQSCKQIQISLRFWHVVKNIYPNKSIYLIKVL